MSIDLMSAVWKGAPYGGTDLLVMLALADFANDAGYCWPSLKTLAKKARLEDCRNLRRHLDTIRRDGFLVREPRPGKSTLTRLLIPDAWFRKPDDTPPPRGDPPSGYPPSYPQRGQGGPASPPTRGQPAPPPGASQPPHPGAGQPPDPSSLDPSGDPSGEPSPRPARASTSPLAALSDAELDAAMNRARQRAYAASDAAYARIVAKGGAR